MADPTRTVIEDLPWKFEESAGGRWHVEIDGILVWVKDYGDGYPDSPFYGWRIGRGGSPLHRLNDGKPYKDPEEAMVAAKRVCVVTVRDKLHKAHETMREALTALDQVTTKL